MPKTSGILQSLRSASYGKPPTPEEPASDERILNLSDDEIKLVPAGKEVCLSVYGTVQDDGFHISRVEAEQESPKDGITPEEVMGMPNRAMPSPS